MAASDPVTAAIESAERVVVTGLVPIPDVGEGAPYRSISELSKFEDAARRSMAESQNIALQFWTCRMKANPPQRLSFLNPSDEELLNREIEAAQRAAIEADRAQKATEAAEQSRKDAAEGKVDMKAVEAAELARQAAVNKAEEARVKYLEAGAAIADFQDLQRRGWDMITWSDLDARAKKRRDAGWWLGLRVPEPANGLKVTGVEAHQNMVKEKSVVTITGQIHNETGKPLSVPDLVVSAIDSKGFVLTAVPITTKTKVPAGETRPFAYDLKPAPDAISRVSVAFSSVIGPPPRMTIQKPDCDAPQ